MDKEQALAIIIDAAREELSRLSDQAAFSLSLATASYADDLDHSRFNDIAAEYNKLAAALNLIDEAAGTCEQDEPYELLSLIVVAQG